MSGPFTIRIFAAAGDLEGMRLINRVNWIGLGVILPRAKWAEVRQFSEFGRAGVFCILVAYRH